MLEKTETRLFVENQSSQAPNLPAVKALISAAGPFNVQEWESLVAADSVKASSIALDLLKDMALMAEGARAGAGNHFLTTVLSTDNVDVNLIRELEDTRTQRQVDDVYKQISLLRDTSSFMLYGVPFDELGESERIHALGFGVIIDFGHFSRIMQKDIAKDDTHKSWLVKDVALSLERNLNAISTHRGEDLWPVPTDSEVEGTFEIASETNGATTSIVASRNNPPNNTYNLSIGNLESFRAVQVPVSKGQGDIVEESKETPEELLRYLSAQFDYLITRYPLEKASKIFDKFTYRLGISDMSIRLAAVQSIIDQNGDARAKVLTVGNTDVLLLTEHISPVAGANEIRNKLSNNINQQELLQIAKDIGVSNIPITQTALSNKQVQKLKGRIFAKISSRNVQVNLIEGADEEIGLGSIYQATHQVKIIPIEKGSTVMFVPPSISRITEGFKNATFENHSEITKALSKLSPNHTSYSFPRKPLLPDNIQEIQANGWSEEMVMNQPDIMQLISRIDNLGNDFEEVFISMQFSHIHPTLPSFTSIQREGAQIASILGKRFKEGGASVEGRTLIDEWHTHDLMERPDEFQDMLETEAKEVFTEVIQESSPPMRMVGDAIVRLMTKDPRTQIPEGSDTLVHFMPDQRVLELWDSAIDPDGQPQLGRQACVPFNTGMDITLMNPQLGDRLFKTYLLNRYPNSWLANAVRENPDASIHKHIHEVMQDPNIHYRNNKRLKILNEVERTSFQEVVNTASDVSAFDLLMLDEYHHTITADLKEGKRIPIVIHILETNYNAQQLKAAYVWENYGFPGIPVFRVSFDPSSKRIKVLESPPPKEDNLGKMLDEHRSTINHLRQTLLNEQ